MGVAHKVKPEIRDFVLEQKNKNPSLSCRKLTALILDSFKAELSKSSINTIIKEAGLSAPVGRTPKKKRRHIDMPRLPVLLEDKVGKATITFPVIANPVPSEAKEPPTAFTSEAPRNDNEEAEKEAEKEVLRQREEEEIAKKAEEEKWAKLAEEERRGKEERLAEEAQEEAEKKAKEEEQRIKFAQLEEEKRAKEEAARKEQEAPKLSAEFSSDKISQIENSGIILLKAVDYCIGASKLIAAAIKHRLPQAEGNFEDLVEDLIYLPLLQGKIDQPTVDKLSGNLEKIENIKVMSLDISRIITSSLQEARCVKVIISDGANLYLDASMYSAWSSPHIPYDFASPLSSLKKHINKYFHENSALVIFNAPGYDMPSPEFFNFFGALDGKGNQITNLVIYGNKFEELEVLPVTHVQKRFFVFGVWPWQFTECRKVKSIGEFRSFRIEGEERNLYIADIEMELRHPNLGKKMSFYGCALKTSLNEKTRLIILSNYTPEIKKSEELVSIYFNHWPNLEETFQDYSRKIELFTYTANSQRYFSAENINLGLGDITTIKDLFGAYLSALDAYARWHLLPAGYENKEFVVIKERFYNLIAELSNKKEGCLAKFILPPGYPFEKDLSYLCRRINEKEVILSNGLKLHLKTD